MEDLVNMGDGVGVWSDDFMGRQLSSEFLTKYVLANDHVKVLNVNSPWGAGKTFFMQRWKSELSKSHVCVMFNAWETDYSAEPLLALITCIEQQTKDELDITAADAGKRAVDLTANILRKAAPLIAKGLVKKYIGVELDDLLGKDGSDNTADGVKDLVSSLIKDQSKTSMHVEEFKSAVVERLSSAAENNNLKVPAFIFIDELDRCRPTYAIELLERIKHFFELKDCKFVIASDSSQLAHSIRAVYGQGFSSENYLKRFFDAEFSLDNTNLWGFVRRSLPSVNSHVMGLLVDGRQAIISNRSGSRKVVKADGLTLQAGGDYPENCLLMVALCKAFDVQLREIVSYIRQIKACCDFIDGKAHFFCLAILVFSRARGMEFYQEITSGDWGVAVSNELNSTALQYKVHAKYQLVEVGDLIKFNIGLMRGRVPDVGGGVGEVQWQTHICDSYEVYPKLSEYKSLVDMAHQLS
ncbi:P-loop NTPase fold protein [Pseudomonas proteolytica]|uniref:KAP family P-loop NTPase fold protein n=1 Tax=Pseudomonas proteolytica TaxID=219574 RepID=UPI0023DE9D7D|nr:P-loop NTPase fold protein [Pseudomonas proteolytica]MDF3162852.1 P-loop NTPase fold protein [Pseudomonas proteolytica]